MPRDRLDDIDSALAALNPNHRQLGDADKAAIRAAVAGAPPIEQANQATLAYVARRLRGLTARARATS
jgi:hypothetical protein